MNNTILLFLCAIAIATTQLKAQDMTLFKMSPDKCYSGSFDYNRKFEWNKIDCPESFDKSITSTTKKNKTKQQLIKEEQRKLKIIAYQKKLINLGYKLKVSGFLDDKTIWAHNRFIKKRRKKLRKLWWRNPTSELAKTRKSFYGKLNELEYEKIITLLESELKTTFLSGKSVLINYSQNGKYCFDMTMDDRDNLRSINNGIRISDSISSVLNTLDFFVYTKDSYNRIIYSQRDVFRLDSGFFYENIFTIHENCKAFFILKPDGNFMKHYGSDYYSKVQNFLKSNEE